MAPSTKNGAAVIGVGAASAMYVGLNSAFVSVAPTEGLAPQREVTSAAGALRGGSVQHAVAQQNSSNLSVGGTLGALASAALLAQSTRTRLSSRSGAASKVALAAFETEYGVQAPLGYWDPAGFSTDGDAATFRRRRVIELKHGRVSMIACIGYITPEFAKFPGTLAPHLGLKFADVPNGLAALKGVPAAGWLQMFAFAGVIDNAFFKDDPTRPAGNFARAGVLGVPTGGARIQNEAERKVKLNSELANGRLAMMAIMGMLFQDGLTGSAWGDWALYTASPLRATAGEAAVAFDPSTQVGATKPLGFWDPFGLGSDEADFWRFRTCELKHGRCAMMATMALVGTNALALPGFDNLSPTALGQMCTYPGSVGLAFIFMGSGYFELTTSDEGGERAGSYGDPFGWANNGHFKYDENFRTQELQNGRLAMLGFVGTIAAEAATGHDGAWQWAHAGPAALDFIQRTIPWAP